MKNHEIIAYFSDGHEPAQYTTAIWYLLVTDPIVKCIIDAETGEVIYEREEV